MANEVSRGGWYCDVGGGWSFDVVTMEERACEGWKGNNGRGACKGWKGNNRRGGL